MAVGGELAPTPTLLRGRMPGTHWLEAVWAPDPVSKISRIEKFAPTEIWTPIFQTVA
jgi:hypothetical protein